MQHQMLKVRHICCHDLLPICLEMKLLNITNKHKTKHNYSFSVALTSPCKSVSKEDESYPPDKTISHAEPFFFFGSFPYLRCLLLRTSTRT